MSRGLAFFASQSTPPPPPPPPNLDGYTANLFSACWLNRLLTAYSGHAIQVRRDSDNTTQNIDFLSGGGLDTVSLLSFCGSASGYISIIYDQSGNGNSYVPPSSSTQPQIVNAGTFNAHMIFDGVNDTMVCVNNHGTPSGISLYSKLKLLSTATGQIILISDAGNVAAGTVSWDYQASTNAFRNIQATQAGTNLVFGTYTGVSATTFGVHAVVSDFSQSSSSARLQYYFESTAEIGSFSTAGSIPTTTTMGAVPWCYGARADLSGAANMWSNGFVIYEVAHNATTADAITAVLDHY